ncbi:MAG: mechanosensitive ion channel family protein [Cyanophyceae cyanobacterium]
MFPDLPETIRIDTPVLVGLVGLLLGTVGFGILVPKLLQLLLVRLSTPQVKTIYKSIFAPFQGWLILILSMVVADLLLLLAPVAAWLKYLEIFLGLSVAIAISWLGAQLFRQFFDIYLLDAALQSRRKINSEFLIIAKFLANSLIILIVVFVFAQAHQINVFGLIASLGIGGLAVAFAAQKTLEQLLGGIVLYIDRPFVVDDYIGLPDGTFGRVESIGLRSTKIRTSGKGTVVIVPNSAITQVNIENFTGAKKVISIIYLTFYRVIPEEEKAFITQVILESTSDIFGIDSRSTEVSFNNVNIDSKTTLTKAQINFFILGSGEVSMDLRRQLLDIANQNITKQLKEYGIAFDIEDKMLDVDSPITV